MLLLQRSPQKNNLIDPFENFLYIRNALGILVPKAFLFSLLCNFTYQKRNKPD